MGTIWVGIDVCKQRLDVAIRPTGEVLSVANDEAGVKQLTKVLQLDLLLGWDGQKI